MFVASMAFFAKISDPAVGGTYMTFLNTIANLGGNWPTTAALYFVDALTFRKCSTDPSNDCSTNAEKEVIKIIQPTFYHLIIYNYFPTMFFKAFSNYLNFLFSVLH